MLGKIRSNNLLTGASVYFISNILNAAIPFALLPILTRYLTQAEYGQVAMFQTLLAALAAFTGLSVHGAANRKFYDANLTSKEMKSYIGACFQLLAFSGVLVFLVVFILKSNFSEWLGLSEGWLLVAVFVSSANFIVQIRLGQWQVRKHAISYGSFQVTLSLLNVLLSLILVLFFLEGVDGRLLGQSVVPIVFSIVAVFLLYRDGLLGFDWRPDYIKEAARFGVPLIPHVAGVFLLTAVDRFVINAKLGIASAGIYMVAVQLAMVMGICFDAFNKAYVPWLFERLKRDAEYEKKKIVRWTYRYFLFLIVIAIFVFAFGQPLVVLIAGVKYSQAGEIIGWLALGQAFNGMYLMVTNYIFFSKRTGFLSLASISSGFLNVLLLLVLVNHFGMAGAAIAYSLSMAVRFLLTWWIAANSHSMPWFNFR